jgi:hypothetical protein
LCVFVLLQVTVVSLTSGREGLEGESRADPPVSSISGGAWLDGGALEHAPPAFLHTIPAGRGFPCNFWSFGDYFVNLNYLM